MKHLFLWLLVATEIPGVCDNEFPAHSVTDGTAAITVEWMVTEADGYIRDLLSHEEWSPQGHVFSYLISYATEPPSLEFYDPVRDATESVLTPLRLGKLLQQLDSGSTNSDTPAEPKEVHLHRYEWNDDNESLRLHAEGRIFDYNLSDQTLDEIKLPAGEKQDWVFSPNRQWIAYTRDNDLYAYELDQRREIRLTYREHDRILNGKLTWVYWEELFNRRGYRAFEWSPDNDSIAYWQFDETGVSTYPLIDFSPVAPVVDTRIFPKAGAKNPSVRVGVARLSTRHTTWIDLGYPYEYIARMNWSPDGDLIAIQALNRDQNRLVLLAANPWDGGSRVLLEERDPHWIDVEDGPHWLKESSDFLWLSERDGYRHIYRISRNGKQITPVTHGSWEVTSIRRIDESRRQVYFEATKQSPLERHLYSVSPRGGAVRQITREHGTHSTTISNDGQWVYDRYADTDTPRIRRMLNHKGDETRVFQQTRLEQYRPYRIHTPELLTFEKEGRRYYGRLFYPIHFDPSQKYPVIVNVYGGPGAQVVTNRFSVGFEQVLAENGFLVFSMDNRGSANRGHAWETPVYRQLGKLEVADQVLGVELLKTRPYVDGGRIGIWGWSYGGYMACCALLMAPEVFHAGAAVAPVTNWNLYDTFYTERYMDQPDDNPDGYKNSSPVHLAGRLQGSLLLIHGVSDDNVHVQHTYQMIDALIAQNKDYRWYAYPQKDHGIWGNEHRVHLFTRILNFFKDQLIKD